MKSSQKQQKREIRHRRVRAKISGTAGRPRLSVFRSNRYIYAQLIDDEKGKSLLSADDRKIQASRKKMKKTDRAAEVGKVLTKEALAKKIKQVVFDRGGLKYTGRIRALAEAAPQGGLKF